VGAELRRDAPPTRPHELGGDHLPPESQTKFAQGWPKLWASFWSLIWIFSQKAGPSRAIWANPVRSTFHNGRLRQDERGEG
jgi:hypothetical protein